MKNDRSNLNDSKFTGVVVFGIIIFWFLFALQMGAEGRYISGLNKPPLALGLSVVAPILGFVIAYSRRGAIRAFAQSLDLRVVVAAQMGRIIAVDFLLCYVEGRLPAGFALPAGIGDIVTGIAAIPLALGLSRGAAATKKRFVAWNIFGLTDLVLAVTLGILHSPSSIGVLAGSGPTTGLMSELPRSMIPTFFVPLYVLLHLLALARRNEVRSMMADGEKNGRVITSGAPCGAVGALANQAGAK